MNRNPGISPHSFSLKQTNKTTKSNGNSTPVSRPPEGFSYSEGHAPPPIPYSEPF